MTVLEDFDLADGVYDGDATWEGMIRNPLTSLTAAAIPVKPPSAWFTNPGFGQLEPLTVTADGQISGHIASWREDHIGMNGRVKAPKSKSGYAFFATGALETQEGTLVNVGQITLTGGHAPLEASVADAVAHYDNTNSAFADVAVGEDKHGIWVAGALRPTVDDGQLRAIRASSVSGDWRPINGSLEMVAVCAVNVPGFPIPRARVASGVPVALVAAGTGELVDLMLHQDNGALEVITASFDDRLRFVENVMLGRIGDSRETLTAAVDAARNTNDDDIEARAAALRASVHPERVALAASLRARAHPELALTAAALRERVHGGGAVPFGEGAPLTAATPFAETLHPRGRDGKFIEKGGLVNLVNFKWMGPGQTKALDLSGRRGQVNDIRSDPKGGPPIITVGIGGDEWSGPDISVEVKPKNIEQAPEKARIGPASSRARTMEAGNITPGTKVMIPGQDIEATVTDVRPTNADNMELHTDMGMIPAKFSDPIEVTGRAPVPPRAPRAPAAAPGTVVTKDGTVLEPGSQVKINGEVFTVNALEPDPDNPGGGLVELDDGSAMPSASKGWYNVDLLESYDWRNEAAPAKPRPGTPAYEAAQAERRRQREQRSGGIDWSQEPKGLGEGAVDFNPRTGEVTPIESLVPAPKDFKDMTPQEVAAEVRRLNSKRAEADFISSIDGATPIHRVDAADVKVGDIIEQDDSLYMVQTIHRDNPNGVASVFQDTDEERGTGGGFGYMGDTSLQPGEEVAVLEVGPESDMPFLSEALGFSDMTDAELANAKKRRKGAGVQQIIDYELERRESSTPGGTLPTPIAPASGALTADALRAQVHGLWDDGMPINADCRECLQASLRARVNGPLVGRATTAWTAKERDKAASSGAAMPGGRFPIKDCTDVGKAVRALGRGKGDKAAIKRHIMKRAKSLGCMSNIPDDWK